MFFACSIVLSAMEQYAETIKKEFKDPFEEQPWNNFFNCAVSFLTQASLQLEGFFPSKRNYILQNYGNMRRAAVEIIKNMWFSIYTSKRIRFIPSMVGTFLEMGFVPEQEVRLLTIPIFYDMMHCEFDQERPVKSFKEVSYFCAGNKVTWLSMFRFHFEQHYSSIR
jgi:dedicator of cytokinesis protein 1